MTFKYSEFVHLHTHSEYSFLDGAIRIKDMVAKAKEQGSPAVALTDHGSMVGGLEFYFSCKSAGIIPIMGFEAYITEDSKARSREMKRNHLILFAEDQEGWRNLMKLSSYGYTDGFYYKPRIDMDVLKAHSKGLIATTACVGGAIPQAIIKGDRQKAIDITDEYLSIFGENNFFYEIQNHGMDDEHVAFEQMIDIGKEKGIPVVVTNDAHYLNHEDYKAHDVLLCMQTQAKVRDEKRFRFASDQFYMKSPEEMAKLFPDLPEALTNTVDIALRCANVDPTHSALLPSIEIPDESNNLTPADEDALKELARGAVRYTYNESNGFDEKGKKEQREKQAEELHKLERKMEGLDLSESKYLWDLAIKGAKKIYGDPYDDNVKERLEYELGVIIWMGFPGYYLIVMDFLLEADRLGIMRGVRGSAAGSLVGYVIGISNVCPLKFDLIFERFLNPERISMPDVDADLADKDREAVIQYCVDKYGRDAVCQIINIGRMKAKAAVKDVARVMDVPVSESNRLSKLIGDESTIAKAINANPELKTLLDTNSLYREVFDYAQRLEGLARQPGMHAAGVIIAPGNVTNWAPLFKPAGEEAPTMTQFDMKYVEESGLIKMDFLGLRTLTVLQDTIKMVKHNHGKEIDLWTGIPEGDENVYKNIFHAGNTIEIFQFESPGMRKYLRKLKPTVIEDLIAMTSLYRPGPMENIDSFIRRKHGEEKIEYAHPMLKDVLDVTYGIIIYQEQVMRIAQVMGGFTLGGADVLRKVMGKKQFDKLPALKVKFVAGAAERNVPEKVADEVWELMAKFAAYGFNKAHACVYAHVSYQSSYFKTYYPQEYMAAVMTSRMGDKDKFVGAAEEAKRMGIEVLPPDVNFSDIDCGVHEGKITIGLGAIAGVGKAAVELVNVRREHGQFSDFYDFCGSVNLRNVSKKAIESLIFAGAFDSVDGLRSEKHAAIDSAVDFGKREAQERELGQTNLFGGEESGVSLPKPALPELPEWDHFEKLGNEKSVLNFYVSGHPLEAYRTEIEGFSTLDFSSDSIKKTRNGASVVIGGIITTVKKVNAKRDGRLMTFMGFDDFWGSGEIFCPPDAYEQFSHLCESEKMVLVRGKTEIEITQGDNDTPGQVKCKVIAQKMIPLEETREKLAQSVHIEVSSVGLENGHIEKIHHACEQNRGNCNVIIHLRTSSENEYKIRPKDLKVSPRKDTFDELKLLDAVDRVWISQRGQ